MISNVTFGEWLKVVRGSKTQVEMATRLGISKQYWNDLERGRRGPSRRVVGLLIDAFNIDRTAMHRFAARAHGWDV